jgi:pyruvate dehydrogenase E2 component (dihydrolipoamide acetyltransferase)
MAKDIRLPQLGQTMEEGTVVNCLVKAGDKINKGDIIFEIETDKATLEMESPAEGFVKHILVNVNDTLPVGELLMVVGDENEDVPLSFIESLRGGAAAGHKSAQAAFSATDLPAVNEPEPSEVSGRVMASPRTRKLAEELGVDITKVKGTGPSGKITEQDVKASVESRPAGKAATANQAQSGQIIPVNNMQKITAEKMLKSKHEIPCFYLTANTDVTGLVGLRTKMNQDSDLKVSYNDFVIKAVAQGLEQFPLMTGQMQGENIVLADEINIGLAIEVGENLVAPILKNVNKKSLKEIAAESKMLIEKTHSNKLALTDLEGGCITVSNLGAFGIENFIPIVVPGQCSILGVGRITDTCVPSNGNILVRQFMNMTLSVDHKVVNGAYAARFLDFVKKQLEDAVSSI